MKLNNKGYLTIEIILASTISFMIMYFLIELTFNLKSKNDDIYKEISFISDKNIITKTVMDDINKNQVTKLDFSCNDASYRCVDITYNDTITKRFRISINSDTKKVEYGVYTGTHYDTNEYYYTKDLSSHLDIENINVENNCYGTNVEKSYDDNDIIICNEKEDDSDTLKNNGLFTIKFNATSQFLGEEKDYGINLTIPYNNLELKLNVPSCFNYQNKTPNTPDLPASLIPIKYDGSSILKADSTNTNNDWYNYSEGKWANAVMVNNNLSTYQNANPGTTITTSDIVAYYVWIPKYSYQQITIEEGQEDLNQICINFESVDANEPTIKEDIMHPAFTFGDTNQSGIWVSKFKTTSESASKANARPSGPTPRLISIFYEKSKNFNNYLSNSDKNNYDVHMIKNTDWGAISYLTYSEYGICNNGDYSCNSITPNNDTYGTTGGGNYVNNTNQSTTLTIYGVYDMKSNFPELVMANFGNIVGHNLNSPGLTSQSNYNHSNFKGHIYNLNDNNYSTFVADENIKCDLSMVGTDNTKCYYEGIYDTNGKIIGDAGDPISMPSSKYYNLYDLYDEEGKYNISLSYIMGDATEEIRMLTSAQSSKSWLNNSGCRNENTMSQCSGFYTWLVRGNSDSILYFSTTYGGPPPTNQYRSRTVLTKK